MLSMDQEYLSRRRKFISQKPRQLVEGVGYGLLSVFLGVGDGIYGVIQQPYIQGRQRGLVGVLQGSAIGMTGLLVKPAAGVLDAASKTAEGLTNTATYFDDKPNQERMRPIRVFYER